MLSKTGLQLAGAATLIFPLAASGSVIVSYNFGPNSTSFTYGATTLAANVTASGLSSTNDFGANTTETPDDGVGGETSWYTNNSGGNYLSVEGGTASSDNGFWVETIVTAASGFRIDPTSFTLNAGAGGSSNTRSVYIFDSADGLPTSIVPSASSSPTITGGDLLTSGPLTAARGVSDPTMNTFTVGSFSAGDANLSAFTVRIYFDTQGQTAKNIDLGSLTLNGSVVPAHSATMVTSKTSAPVGYSQFLGTSNPSGSASINLTGSNGNYSPGYLNNISTTQFVGGGSTGGMSDKGYVSVSSLNPTSDAEYLALAITVTEGGNSAESLSSDNTLLNDIIGDLRTDGVTAYSFGTTDSGNSSYALPAGDAVVATFLSKGETVRDGQPFDILISTTDPQYFAFDFSNEIGNLSGAGGTLNSLNITDIAAVPEPAGLAMVLSVGGLLLRRRRNITATITRSH